MRPTRHLLHISPPYCSSLDLSGTVVAFEGLRGSLDGSARATDGLLEVLWLELTVFIVAVRFFDGDGHRVKDIRGLLEDIVHLLQGTVPSFREEEVNTGDHECITGIVSLGPFSGNHGTLT